MVYLHEIIVSVSSSATSQTRRRTQSRCESAGSGTNPTYLALDCDAITALVLQGQSELSFDVEVTSFSISPAMLGLACGAAGGTVADKALGLFDLELGVQVGGDVRLRDADQDGAIDGLRSDYGYGGTVTRFGTALAPRVVVNFAAPGR
jgi:hypothetical protein